MAGTRRFELGDDSDDARRAEEDKKSKPGLKDVKSSTKPWSAGVADTERQGQELADTTAQAYEDAKKKKGSNG